MRQKTHRRTRNRFTAAGALPIALALVLTGGGVGALAFHKKDSKRITLVSRSDAGATHLARSIVESKRSTVVRSKFVTVPPGGAPVGASTRRLSGFPRQGRAFAILSTGCAQLAARKDNLDSTGCRNGGVKTRGARDVVIWRIRVRVPRGDNCLSFRFKFLSEEYPEWVNSSFNDAFVAELTHAPRWRASTNQRPGVTAPRNFATTRDGNLISISGTGIARVSPRAARGTTYDAATGLLRASTRVKPGQHLLHLSLFDQGDRQYDSAVFIDRLLVRNTKNCISGVVKSG